MPDCVRLVFSSHVWMLYCLGFVFLVLFWTRLLPVGQSDEWQWSFPGGVLLVKVDSLPGIGQWCP